MDNIAKILDSSKELPTKDFIRQCAFELFREYGYDKVSVSNICSKAGISRSAFYYYFDTKASVMGSLFSDLVPDHWEEIQQRLKTDDAWDFLWWFISLYADRCLSLGKKLLAVFMAVSLHDETATFLPYDALQFFNILDEAVMKGQVEGRFGNRWMLKYIVAAIRSVFIGVTFDWCNSVKNGEFDYKRALELELRALLNVL